MGIIFKANEKPDHGNGVFAVITEKMYNNFLYKRLKCYELKCEFFSLNHSYLSVFERDFRDVLKKCLATCHGSSK